MVSPIVSSQPSLVSRLVTLSFGLAAFVSGVVLTFNPGATARPLKGWEMLLSIAPIIFASSSVLTLVELVFVVVCVGNFGDLLMLGSQEFVKHGSIYSTLEASPAGEYLAEFVGPMLLGAAIGCALLLPVVGLNGVFKDNPVARRNFPMSMRLVVSISAMFLTGLAIAHICDSCSTLLQASVTARIGALFGMLFSIGISSAVLGTFKKGLVLAQSANGENQEE